MQVPVGTPELRAEPQATSLESWTALASGALRLESDVQIDVVEPLLNMIADAMTGVTAVPKLHVGKLVPDNTLVGAGRLIGLVEVKLGSVPRTAGDPGQGQTSTKSMPTAKPGRSHGLLVDAGPPSVSRRCV